MANTQAYEPPPKLEGFDRVFPLIGGHHRYQWILLALTSLGVSSSPITTIDSLHCIRSSLCYMPFYIILTILTPREFKPFILWATHSWVQHLNIGVV